MLKLCLFQNMLTHIGPSYRALDPLRQFFHFIPNFSIFQIIYSLQNAKAYSFSKEMLIETFQFWNIC